MQQKAALGVAAITATWGFVGLLVRWIDLPAVVIVFSRASLGALALGSVLAVRHRTRAARGAPGSLGPTARRTPRWTPAVLGAVLALHWVLLVSAQQRAALGTVLLITYLAPVLVTLLAPRMLGEVVPARTYVAAALGLVGVAVLVRPGSGFGAGEVLALGAALTFALLTVLSKAAVADVGGPRLAFAELGVAAVLLSPLALTASWGPARIDWWWMIVLGVVLTGGLLAAYFALLDVLPAATVGVLSYVEPVVAVLVAWAFLGETPTASLVLGGVLVVGAGIMVLPRSTAPAVARDGTVPGGVPR